MSRTGAEKSNFSVTCNLLSQYLKEKGSLPDISLGMNRTRESKVEHETPKTMNLLPGLGSSGDNGTDAAVKNVAPANTADITVQHTAPMTIFYGGRVTVFDNFPADKAKELFAMVCRGSPVAGSNTSPHDAATPASTSGGGGAVAVVPLQKPALPLASDLPIARRISLNRFLEKRKDRISSKAPYQVHASPDVVSASTSSTTRKAEVEQPWLALAPSKLEGTF